MPYATQQRPDARAPNMEELDFADETVQELSLHEVSISPEARLTLGLAVQEIARHCHRSEHDIIRLMQRRIYWLEPSGRLVFVFAVPGVDADMFIEVPSGYWQLKGSTSKTQ